MAAKIWPSVEYVFEMVKGVRLPSPKAADDSALGRTSYVEIALNPAKELFLYLQVAEKELGVGFWVDCEAWSV